MQNMVKREAIKRDILPKGSIILITRMSTANRRNSMMTTILEAIMPNTVLTEIIMRIMGARNITVRSLSE